MSIKNEISILRSRIIELEAETRIAKAMLREEIANRETEEEMQEPISHEQLLELGFEPDYGDGLAIIGEPEFACEYKFVICNNIELVFWHCFQQLWSVVYCYGSVAFRHEIRGPLSAKELNILIQCLQYEKEEST